VLSAALREIRRRRGMRVADVAAAMNLSQRAYEQFEAGRGRLNIDYVRRFARVTDSDPLAILAAVHIGSPAFAVRCADNKLTTILFMALEEFDGSMGDRIAQEDARTLVEAFTRMFRSLDEENARRAAEVRDWLSRKS
jgi:transcriptional regulator with XRE-family HTH domain